MIQIFVILRINLTVTLLMTLITFNPSWVNRVYQHYEQVSYQVNLCDAETI